MWHARPGENFKAFEALPVEENHVVSAHFKYTLM